MQYSTKNGKISGSVLIPGSKSHTIRALLLASLAEGTSHISNFLYSKDTEACLNACKLLGAKIEDKKGHLTVTGINNTIRPAQDIIDVGNSGTTLYLTAPLAACSEGYTVFTGDNQIKSRPIQALLTSLCDLGALAVSTKGNGSAPIVIKGKLKGGETTIECPTSQYLSGLLLATPLGEGTSVINVPLLHEKPYVDITLRWLEKAGIQLSHDGYERYEIAGGQKYKKFDVTIPGDFSSATFFMCAAALSGSEITLEGLDMTDAQGDKAVLGMLEQMGCLVSFKKHGITINGKNLHGAELDLNATPDALPALAVTACFAKGKTVLGNVPQARLKETDRIAVMFQELKKLGANITELDDGLIIEHSPLNGGSVCGHDDHRIIMAMAIAGLASKSPIIIDDIDAAGITFPTFFELLDKVRN